MNRSAALRCGSMESASRRAGSESGAATEFMAPHYASKVGGRSSRFKAQEFEFRHEENRHCGGGSPDPNILGTESLPPIRSIISLESS
jgi:hypothetical protein